MEEEEILDSLCEAFLICLYDVDLPPIQRSVRVQRSMPHLYFLSPRPFIFSGYVRCALWRCSVCPVLLYLGCNLSTSVFSVAWLHRILDGKPKFSRHFQIHVYTLTASAALRIYTVFSSSSQDPSVADTQGLYFWQMSEHAVVIQPDSAQKRQKSHTHTTTTQHWVNFRK